MQTLPFSLCLLHLQLLPHPPTPLTPPLPPSLLPRTLSILHYKLQLLLFLELRVTQKTPFPFAPPFFRNREKDRRMRWSFDMNGVGWGGCLCGGDGAGEVVTVGE